jgi:NAD(P)H-hydrate epimerase
MARLTGRTIEEVQQDRIGLATEVARGWRAVVVLKGARTVVADPEGTATLIPTGNAGLATGGTGDVLAGLVGALVAGGIRPASAARAAAWIHGRAGDLAAARHGERGLLAGDVAEALGAVWVEWRR